MFFITLNKWKKTPSKEYKSTIDKATKTFDDLKKKGINVSNFWTFGRYDAVSIIEVSSEQEVLKILLSFQDLVETETLLAIPREEAINLI